MPLTQVSMWTEHGWKRVFAEDIYKIYGGKISSKSCMFVCDICGQNVSLAKGDIRKPYFKHSRGEHDKKCSERTSNYTKNNSFQLNELPIRINIKSNSCFNLEIGFISLPDNIEINDDNNITITSVENNKNENYFNYSFDRLNDSGITYLSVGEIPYEAYKIQTNLDYKDIEKFYPSLIEGIKKDGTLFDKVTRKKLVKNSDVQVGKSYYLLTQNKIFEDSIKIEEICCVNFLYKFWRVYEVVANEFNELVAKFFLRYNCRLTEKPVKMHTLWPIHVELPYKILHKDINIKMFFQGDAKIKSSKNNNIVSILNIENSNIVSFDNFEKQQIIFTERYNVIDYLYFFRNDLDYTIKEPDVKVRDYNNNFLNCGKQNTLPIKKSLYVIAPFDGEIIIRNKGKIINKYSLKSNEEIIVNEINYNFRIEILQGLDCVWWTEYIEEKIIDNEYELKILKKLQMAKSDIIPIPHTLGALSNKLDMYPNIQKWLYKKIRTGYIEYKALLILKSIV